MERHRATRLGSWRNPSTEATETTDSQVPEVAEEPATAEIDVPPATTLPDDGKLLFNFRYQPWQDVLDWFAEQSDLSLVLESAPPGTFNYTDSKRYTPAEALDILNSVLLTKGYTLVRRGRMLILVYLEDGIPPNLVTDVSLDELDERGEYELVRVLFKLRNMTPAVAAEEVEKLVGPQGRVDLLPRAGMIQVTETAGRCRAIREVIEAVEQPAAAGDNVRPFELEYILAEDALPVLRQMLAIDDDKMATDDETLRLAIDTLTGKILAFGTPEKIARLQEVLQLIDVPEAAEISTNVADALQLEVYSTTGADPESVLAVLQTLLAETPGLRLAADPATGNVVALATSADQATIQATITQMQTDSRQIEAIPLYTVDVQTAALAVTRLFIGSGTEEKPDPRAPIVDADLDTNTLLVRASPSQVEQIRDLLSKLGERSDGQAYADMQRGNIRTLPLSGSSARTALEQVEKLWPMMGRPNPIRIVIPSSGIQSYRPSESGSAARAPLPFNLNFDDIPGEFLDDYLPPRQPNRDPDNPAGADPSASTLPTPSLDRSARAARRVPATLAAMQQDAADEQILTGEATESTDEAPSEQVRNRAGAPIVAAPGPGGTIIASQDLEALDALEQMLSITAGSSYGSTREYAVFYLKYAKASAAAETLSQMFGGGGDAGGGGLMGGIADAALGDLGGGLMGDLLGLGGGGSVTGFSAGGVDIVADARLNLLLVYGQPEDIDKINQVLEILDQSEGPEEVVAEGKPRLIPVYNTSAAEIAQVVQSVYADRMQSSGSGGQPSAEDILRALRGGRGGGGGGGGETQEPEKMTIGVDERSNSIVVRASDPLFEQVRTLVQELDELQRDSTQATKIVSLKFSNSDAVKQALEGVFGSDAVTTSSGSSTVNARNNGGGGSNDARRTAEEMQRRMEFIRRMQQQSQPAGGGRGGQPGGGRGGPPGGGRPGGGRGGRG